MPPDYRPNPIARVVAVVALMAAFFLIVFVIAGSGGNSDNGGDDSPTAEETSGGPTAKGSRAAEQGVWIVREGDTLAQISEETGMDVDDILALNPDLDPQALIQGQRIALR